MVILLFCNGRLGTLKDFSVHFLLDSDAGNLISGRISGFTLVVEFVSWRVSMNFKALAGHSLERFLKANKPTYSYCNLLSYDIDKC